MPWYKTGTVSVTQNSNAVIGAGTAFIANSRVGDGFRGPDGRWYEVTNIASNTALSISPNYEGPTAAGGFYSIMPVQGYQKDLSDQVRAILNDYGEKLAALGTTGNYDILPPSKGGTGIIDLSVFMQRVMNKADEAAVRVALVAAKSGSNADITSLTGLTTALSVEQGGTGGKTQGEARAGIGAQAVDTTLTELSGAGFVKKFSDNSLLFVRGYRRMPDGGIDQWGIIGLSAVGAFNPQTIGGVTWYTHFYTVTLPIGYVSDHYAVVASINGAPSYAQAAMTPAMITTDKRVTNATESRTSFTVAICTPITGWIPYINFRSTGK